MNYQIITVTKYYYEFLILYIIKKLIENKMLCLKDAFIKITPVIK